MNQTTITPATPRNPTSTTAHTYPANLTPTDYTYGYQDAVHGSINIHAYDTSKEYQKGFDAGCMDVRECEALNGELEEF